MYVMYPDTPVMTSYEIVYLYPYGDSSRRDATSSALSVSSVMVRFDGTMTVMVCLPLVSRIVSLNVSKVLLHLCAQIADLARFLFITLNLVYH